MRLFKLIAITFAAALLLAAQDELPEGKGKDVVVRVCTSCHGVSAIAEIRTSKKGWTDTVNEMAGRGADGTDEDFAVIIDYLSTHFGKQINVNKATAQELQSGLSLTADESAAIIKYREEKGDFKTLRDLLQVPGVSAQKLQDQSANIVF